MAEPSVQKDDDFPCILRGCDKPGSPCVYTCVRSDPFLSPPPPPPPPPPPTPTAESHVAPFLIATVCFLGISFLLLTTCTIILRYRFSRLRRRNSTVRPDQTPVQDDDFSDGSVVDHPIWHIATVGLQQSAIDSITAFKYYKIDGFLSDGNNNDCSVCLTEFEDGDDLRLLPKCSHAFHISCIDTWLRSHKNCPLCRSPVVNDPEPSGGFPQGVNFSAIQLSSGNLDGGQQVEVENSGHYDGGLNSVVSLDEENNGDQSSSTSNQLRERRDNLTLPIEGIRIAEILKKNRELRILSDLGENYRFRGEDDDGVEPIRRSFSFNSVAASAIYGAMSNISTMGSNEGCSSNTSGGGVGQEKKINVVERVSKRGSSMSGLLIKSSSIGRSLQKAPVSMKRSLSSSSKFFSFRKTKSQASILPL